MPAGEYTLEIGMFFGDEPIKLGIKAERQSDGGYCKLIDFSVDKL